ncbi:MAG: hypothetical protein ACUVRD_00625 [Bacteroidia bacterium]
MRGLVLFGLGMGWMRAYPFLEAMVLAHLLPAETFGFWSLGYQYFQSFYVLSGLGLGAALWRYEALGQETYLAAAQRDTLRINAVLAGVYVGLGPFVLPRQAWLAAWAYLFSLLTQALWENYLLVLRSHYEIDLWLRRLLLWQMGSSSLPLLGAWIGGVYGLVGGKLAAQLWEISLAFVFRILGTQKSRLQREFYVFGLWALGGNVLHTWSMTLITFFLSWKGATGQEIALYRISSLLPWNLAILTSWVVGYRYPFWVKLSLRKARGVFFRDYLMLGGIVGLGAAAVYVGGKFWVESLLGGGYTQVAQRYRLYVVAGVFHAMAVSPVANFFSARGSIRMFFILQGLIPFAVVGLMVFFPLGWQTIPWWIILMRAMAGVVGWGRFAFFK